MKLIEIYNTPPDSKWDDVDNNSYELPQSARREVSKIRSSTKNHRYIGNGLNAYVGTNDDENFGDVQRVASADDGGSLYLARIANHPEWSDNPFFPRVRSISGEDGEYQVAIIERLIPFTTEAIYDNEELMLAIWSRYFVGRSETFDRHPGIAIVKAVRNSLYKSTVEYIKDKQLRAAMEILIKMRANDPSAFYPDIHPGNVMWRPHPYQPQLVITDPFISSF